MKSFIKCLSIAVMGAVLAGCASDIVYVPPIPSDARGQLLDYFEQHEPKVFVIAIDSSGEYASGYAFGQASLKEAAKIAVEICDANCEIHAILAKPYIYAVNNKVVHTDMIRQAHPSSAK